MASSTTPSGSENVDETRAAIANVDAAILSQLARRIDLVGQLSGGTSGPICATETLGTIEHIVASAIASQPELASVDASDLQRVLRHLASVSLKSVGTGEVTCLGPLFSFTHLAAMKYFGAGAAFNAVGTIEAVFDAVGRGDTNEGIVPIENSTDGRVIDTLGMFLRTNMGVCGEVLLPIHHCLLSKTPRSEIKEVHSKPQALSQCRGWLAKHLPGVALIENTSTAAAAKLASENRGVAAVASAEAGHQYGLDVVVANIEDRTDNVTRFAVLGKRQPEPTGDDKTSLLFQLLHKPGALADAMSIFKSNALNLTWIESFPEPGKPNEYRFFVELSGHRDEAAVAKAIEMLSGETKNCVKVLGSYPRAML